MQLISKLYQFHRFIKFLTTYGKHVVYIHVKTAETDNKQGSDRVDSDAGCLENLP